MAFCDMFVQCPSEGFVIREAERPLKATIQSAHDTHHARVGLVGLIGAHLHNNHPDNGGIPRCRDSPVAAICWLHLAHPIKTDQ